MINIEILGYKLTIRKVREHHVMDTRAYGNRLRARQDKVTNSLRNGLKIADKGVISASGEL